MSDIGISKENIDPCPGVDLTFISSPPNAYTSIFEIYNPKPDPVGLSAKVPNISN